jgi:hypothetical protein
MDILKLAVVKFYGKNSFHKGFTVISAICPCPPLNWSEYQSDGTPSCVCRGKISKAVDNNHL